MSQTVSALPAKIVLPTDPEHIAEVRQERDKREHHLMAVPDGQRDPQEVYEVRMLRRLDDQGRVCPSRMAPKENSLEIEPFSRACRKVAELCAPGDDELQFSRRVA